MTSNDNRNLFKAPAGDMLAQSRETHFGASIRCGARSGGHPVGRADSGLWISALGSGSVRLLCRVGGRDSPSCSVCQAAFSTRTTPLRPLLPRTAFPLVQSAV